MGRGPGGGLDGGPVLVYALYSAASEGAEKALVADSVPAVRRGTAYGWFNLAVGIAALPASVLFGLLYRYAGPATAFGASASLALAASLLLLFLPTPGRTAARS